MSIYSPCPATLFGTEWLHLSTRFCPPCSTLSFTVWETKIWRGAWGSWWAGGNPSQKEEILAFGGYVHGFLWGSRSCFCWFLIHMINSCRSVDIHKCHGCWVVSTSLHMQLLTMETLWWFSNRLQVYQNLGFQFSYICSSLPVFLFSRKPHLFHCSKCCWNLCFPQNFLEHTSVQ